MELPSPEHEPMPDDLEQLKQKLNILIDRGERLGIEIGAQILANNSGKPVINRNPNKPFYAASIQKPAIALAHASLDRNLLGGIRKVNIPSHGEFPGITGGGRFDQPKRPRLAELSEVYEDSLSRSGNIATKVLVNDMGGPEVVNEFLDSQGYTQTRLTDLHDGKGGFYMGETSANEALKVMLSITENKDDDIRITMLVRYLAGNQQTGGIRRFAPDGTDLVIADKQGSYKKDKDILYHTRHDVGIIDSENGWLGFAVLTGSPTRPQAYLADQLIGQIGVEMFDYLGAEPRRLKMPARMILRS